jgi:hypothetical protein
MYKNSFANAAIAANMVSYRNPFKADGSIVEQNVSRYSTFWGADGVISLNKPISNLSQDARDLIVFSQFHKKSKPAKKAEDPGNAAESPATDATTDEAAVAAPAEPLNMSATSFNCYRLACALIKHFSNDVEFYKHKSSSSQSLSEAVKSADWERSDIELEYTGVPVEVETGPVIDNNWFESPYRDTKSFDASFTYKVDPYSVVDFLWDELTEEDVADVPGGLAALDADSDLCDQFLNKHLDDLVEKYNDKLLKRFFYDAVEYYENNYEDEDNWDWDDLND